MALDFISYVYVLYYLYKSRSIGETDGNPTPRGSAEAQVLATWQKQFCLDKKKKPS